MALTLVTAPTAEPVSIFDLKTQLRIDGALEDPYLLTCLHRAQAYLAEGSGWTGIACLTSTWDYALDCFPWGASLRDRSIRLPLRPVQSVSSVKYIDEAGVQQTMSAADYVVYPNAVPPMIAPDYLTVWPTPRRQIEAVTVRFIAGWTGPAAMSANVRNALVLLAGHFYTHRDDGAPVPDDLLVSLLASERVYA